MNEKLNLDYMAGDKKTRKFLFGLKSNLRLQTRKIISPFFNHFGNNYDNYFFIKLNFVTSTFRVGQHRKTRANVHGKVSDNVLSRI